jgi:hypothetical protein
MQLPIAGGFGYADFQFLSNPDAPDVTSGLWAVNFQICTETAID